MTLESVRKSSTSMSDQDFLLERNSNISGPEMLADALAWAVKHDIPFSIAIDMVKKEMDKPFFSFWTCPWGWDSALHRTQLQLDEGKQLSEALEIGMKRFLPEFFIQAVRKGEETENLELILPQLSQQMGYLADVKSSGSGMLVYFAAQLTVVLVLCGGLMVFIVPKFRRILEELLEGEPMPWTSELMITVGRIAQGGLGLMRNSDFSRLEGPIELLLLLPILIYLYITCKQSQRIASGVLKILSYAPLLGPHVRRLATVEVCSAMAAFLRIEEDLMTAATWCAESTRFPWMAARLKRLVGRLENGEEWASAWQEMRLSSPAFNWVIRNAAVRNRPDEGFEVIASWERQRLKGSEKLIARIFESGLVLINASVVSLIVFGVFTALMLIITKLASSGYAWGH